MHAAYSPTPSACFPMKTLTALFLLAVAAHAADLIEHARAHPDGRAAFSFDASAWGDAEATRHLPIGVFDSGIGGLTVLDALLTLDAFHNDTLQPGADGYRSCVAFPRSPALCPMAAPGNFSCTPADSPLGLFMQAT